MVVMLKRLLDDAPVAILDGDNLSYLDKATADDRISLDNLFNNVRLSLRGHIKVVKGQKVSVTEVVEMSPGDPDFIQVLLGDLPIYGYEIERTESE